MRATTYVALTTLAVLACSRPSSTSTSSTVEGKLEAATFSADAPTAIDAIDEAGARTHVQVGADGAFKLAIVKGHDYRLVALTAKGEEPIVFPRTGGRLDRTFRVSSGAAVVALGAVRHFDHAPQTFSVNDEGKTSCEDGSQGAAETSDGECENGKDAKTGQACMDAPEDAADPAQPMAVPERNPPSDVGGCEDGANDGESDD